MSVRRLGLKVAVLLVVGVGIGAVLWRSIQTEAPTEVGAVSETQQPAADQAQQVDESVPLPIAPEFEVAEELPPTADPEATRTPIEEDLGPSLITGRVQSTTGLPIEGAQVSWTAWDPELLWYVSSAVEFPVAVVEARSLRTVTGENGWFSFHDAPPLLDGEPSVLWVTHPSFYAASLELGAEESSLDDLPVFELTGAPRISARALLEGEPVVGATIHQQLAFPHGQRAEMTEAKTAPKSLLVFHRAYEAGADGRVALARHHQIQRLVAQHETASSRPWIGQVIGNVDLELAPQFTLAGSIDIPDGINLNWGVPRIQVSRWRGRVQDEVGTVSIAEDGSFGPAALPALDADQYVARVVGGNRVAADQRFDPPAEGDEVVLQFKAVKGESKWLRAFDEADEVIPNAHAIAKWNYEGVAYERRIKGDKDGYLLFSGIPAGTVSGVVMAPGKTPIYIDPIALPEESVFVLDVVLLAGHGIRGRCLRGDVPVPDFEVQYWAAKDPTRRGKITVVESADGEFVIDDLPSPQCMLTAISPSFERSDSVMVDLVLGQTDEPILQLEPPRAVTGRVVDGVTGEPIAGASITAYSSQIYTELEPLGFPVISDADGAFELERLSRGSNVLEVFAPGYSTREQKVFVDDEASVDLGSVELRRGQALTARLLLPEGEDPSQWMMVAEGIGSPAPTRFDANGEIRIEHANEGAWRFEVMDVEGMGSVRDSQRRWLKFGEEWHIEFNLVGGRSLVVSTQSSGKPEDNEKLHATVEFVGVHGHRTSRFGWMDANGEFRVSAGVGPGKAVIRIHDEARPDGRSGQKIHEITADDLDEVVIDVPLGTERLRARVVDERGKPLAGVAVLFRSTHHKDLQLFYAITGGDGELWIPHVPPEADLIDLRSPLGGVHTGIEFDSRAHHDDVLEIVFDMSASVQLRIVDGGVPQSTVTSRLWSLENEETLTSGKTPEADGRLTLDRLCPGPYELRIDGPQHWPVRRIVEATDGSGEQVIEVRRLGSLNLEFVSASGESMAGLVVELENLDLGERAQNWIAAGVLRGFDAGLVTDGNGGLAIPKLPHGEYSWSAGGASGVFDLEPGEVLAKRLIIP